MVRHTTYNKKHTTLHAHLSFSELSKCELIFSGLAIQMTAIHMGIKYEHGSTTGSMYLRYKWLYNRIFKSSLLFL